MALWRCKRSAGELVDISEQRIVVRSRCERDVERCVEDDVADVVDEHPEARVCDQEGPAGNHTSASDEIEGFRSVRGEIERLAGDRVRVRLAERVVDDDLRR